jgi:hypothetical protein
MPNGQPTPFEFEDSGVRYAIDVDHDAEKLRVRVASTSDGANVGAAFELSIVGAQRFSMQLPAALTRLINNR